MPRVLAAAVAAGLVGCVTYPAGSRVGQPPVEGPRVVHDALNAVALKSLEAHVRGDGWVPHRASHGSSGSTEEHRWYTHFACQKPGEFPVVKVWPLPESDYERILTPIRADVLKAVEKVGVEVTAATPVGWAPGAPRVARFEITYSREGGAVAGVVEGLLGPKVFTGGVTDEYVDVGVRVREWYTR